MKISCSFGIWGAFLSKPIPKGSRYIKGVCSLYYTNTPTKQKIYKNYKSIVSEDLILKKSIFQNDNITIEKCK